MHIDDWQDNGDGTWTVKSEDATLWDVYGAEWKEKSGYEGDPRNLQVGDIVGNKREYHDLWESISSTNIQEKNVNENENYFIQGLIGTGEILSGLACDVGITFYVAGREAAALKMQGTLDPSVGAEAMSGYTLGGVLMADGINMLSSAINKKSSSPIFWDLFENIFLSSPYQDVGEAIESYQKGKDK